MYLKRTAEEIFYFWAGLTQYVTMGMCFLSTCGISGELFRLFFPLKKTKSVMISRTSLKEEYVVEVKGKVTEREQGTENANIKTGNIEVNASDLTILSSSKALPFRISEKANGFWRGYLGWS